MAKHPVDAIDIGLREISKAVSLVKDCSPFKKPISSNKWTVLQSELLKKFLLLTMNEICVITVSFVLGFI